MKKRILSLFLVVAMVAAMIPAFGVAVSANTQVEADTSWYDANSSAKTYTITTAEELLGFSKLLATGNHTFEGWTVTLGADIDLNPGWTAGPTEPTNKWADTTFESNVSGTFKGVFNGDGHTVSGIYLKAENGASANFTGIFGGSVNGGVVKNLSIVNSYVEGGQHLGAIFGACNQKAAIENVYCEAIVKTKVTSGSAFVGGLIGYISGQETPITNCVFNGSVEAENADAVAGFVGRLAGTSTANFKYSAFYGSVQANGNGVAGLVGTLESGSKVKLYAEDCIIAGSISIANGKTGGSLYGLTTSGNTVGITDVYYTNITENGTIKTQPFISGAVEPSAASTYGHISEYELKMLDADGLLGKGLGTMWPTADLPMPVGLLAELYYKTDTSWYSDSETSFTISTAGELLGFSELLAAGTTFAGQTVKLGADIDLNPNWTASATAPTYTWADVSNKSFGGIFDGDGHTVSGIYLSSESDYTAIFGGNTLSGATVKNLVILNSYVSGGAHCGGLFSYMAPVQQDTNSFKTLKVYIDNVYCDVDVVTPSTQYGGGFMGFIYGGTLEISNSVYAGDVVGTTTTTDCRIGGFVGAVSMHGNFANEDYPATLIVKNSAFYGNVSGRFVGGIVASLGTRAASISKLEIENCIVAGGEITDSQNANYGSIYGGVSGTVKGISISNCYYPEDIQAYPDGITVPDEGSTYNKTTDAYLKKQTNEGLARMGFETWSRTAYLPMPDSLAAIMTEAFEYDRDTDWYLGDSDTTTSEYTISTPEELLGFSDLLAFGSTFAGKTIKLGADINLNPAWTAGSAVAANSWAPVSLDNLYSAFKGTFDGQGNTISGIYLKDEGTTGCTGIFGGILNADATVKNVKIVNSYLNQYSAAGGLYGAMTTGTLTVDNVYLDAKMTFRFQRVGGFVGWQEGGTLNISNSVFAGDAVSTTTADDRAYLGGFVGYIGHQSYANEATPSVTNISNSRFIGSLTARYVGGFIGRIGHSAGCVSEVNIENCVSAGSIISWEEKVGGAFYGGTYVGTSSGAAVASNATVNVTNSYYNDILEVSGDALTAQNILAGTLTATGDDGTTLTSIMPSDTSTVYYKSAAEETDTTLGGYQYGITEETEGDIRLIGVVKVPEGKAIQSNYKSFGFDIKMFNKNGDEWTNLENDVIPAIYNLYTGVRADGKDVTAGDLGGDYVFLSTVSGIPSYVGEVTFVIRTFHDDIDGTRVFGETKVIRYDTDAVKVNGLTGEFYDDYISNGEQYQKAYTGATSADFDAYVTALTEAGYTKYSENTIGENRYATYVTKDNEVNLVYFGGTENRLYVTKNARGYLPATEEPEYVKVTDGKVTQIAREGAANTAPGNSYVVQLEDGSFVIIDGGPANENDQAALLAYLQANKPESHEKPKVIWMLTHLHNDHAELAINFLKANSENIDLSLICYSFPNADMLTEAACAKNYNKIKALSELYPDAQTYAFHTGQTLMLPGCEIEILYTQAEHWLIMDDKDNSELPFTTANDTCATWRMTFTGGKSFLVLGDSEDEMCEKLTAIYGEYLESDVLQVCHHGQNGISNDIVLALYKAIDPKICLWPTTEDNDTLALYKYAAYNSFLLNNTWTRGDSESGDRTHKYADVTATVNMSDLTVTVDETTAS